MDYKWYRGTNDEYYSEGPFDSREEALSGAELPCHIVEACNPPLRLSEWVDTERMLMNAEERISDSDRVNLEYDYDAYFEISLDQENDLSERIKRTIDQWQDDHGLVFKTNQFLHVKNYEYVE